MGWSIDGMLLWLTAIRSDTRSKDCCLGSESEKAGYSTCDACDACTACHACQRKKACVSHPFRDWDKKELEVLGKIVDIWEGKYEEPKKEEPTEEYGILDSCGRLSSTKQMTPVEMLGMLNAILSFIAERPVTLTPLLERMLDGVRQNFNATQKKVISSLGSTEPRQAAETDPEKLKDLEFMFRGFTAAFEKYVECIYALQLKAELLMDVRKDITAKMPSRQIEKLAKAYYGEYCDARLAYQDAFRMPLDLSPPAAPAEPAAPAAPAE